MVNQMDSAVYWYLTYACNLQCQHCWIGGPEEREYDQLSDEGIWKAVNSVIAAKPVVVCLSGGEPLLHPRFGDIVTNLLRADCRLLVETNATLVTPALIDIIEQADACPGKILFLVSLDGTEPQHDAVRGVGAFRSAIEGMQLLRSRDIPFEVQCTLNGINVGCISDVTALAVNELGTRRLKFGFTYCIGSAQANWDALRLEPEESTKAVELVLETMVKYPGRVFLKAVPGELPVSVLFRLRNAVSKCLITNCHFPLLGILPDGTITICTLTRHDPQLDFGNITQKPLWDVWESPVLESLRNVQESRSISGICARCIFLSRCAGGCRALAYQQYGSFSSAFPACQALADRGLFPKTYVRQTTSTVMDSGTTRTRGVAT